MTSSRSRQPVGLRERKKAKTRAAIQRHALRLFREQGYAATTVDQIAEAAEISQSTFFRYFPTKEDTVLYDGLDPVLMRVFAEQPAELSPTAAIRTTMRQVFDSLAGEDWEIEQDRQRLTFEVPELRARAMSQFADGITMLAEGAAARLGRSPDDFEVRNWAGAIIGVILAAMMDRADDGYVRLEEALSHLEAGLPL
ncbi:TetR family transcriptional regulator [Amycolatopsis sp. cg5]|uniref:acyl-CoA-like ligand-binding transcription factor n=1 Tax=Amycolatopsis sp. cg5 TaxID=3238802 RepID=UPI003523DF6C